MPRKRQDVANGVRPIRDRWNHRAGEVESGDKWRAAIVSHEGGGDLMINVLNGTLDMGVARSRSCARRSNPDRSACWAVLGDKRLVKIS